MNPEIILFYSFSCRTEFYKNTFVPNSIFEWNNLIPNVRKSESFAQFRKRLLTKVRPTQNSVFMIRDSTGLKLLTRLRLGLSQLKEHKFNHNFENTINPLCPCSLDTESVSHFFLRCHNYSELRLNLKNELRRIDE